MDVVRHDARLDAPLEHGGSRRATLELAASRGSQTAIQALTRPEYPEPLEYLLEWSRELVGRSGVGMDGFAPLTWEAIDAWARRTGRNPTPDECNALMLLDGAFRHPEQPDDPVSIETPTVAVVHAWPTKKSDTTSEWAD